MKQKRFVVVLAVLLSLVMTTPVFAGGGTSQSRTFEMPFRGWTYHAYTFVDTRNAHTITSTTRIYASCRRSLGVGSFGASSRLYDANGFLIAQSTMGENHVRTWSLSSTITANLPRSFYQGVRFHTLGRVRVRDYTAGGFEYWNIGSSGAAPRILLNPSMEQRLYDEFNVALSTNGMIPALSVLGLEGWVFARELYPSFNYGLGNGVSYKYINVYTENGDTIICRFKIQAPLTSYR